MLSPWSELWTRNMIESSTALIRQNHFKFVRYCCKCNGKAHKPWRAKTRVGRFLTELTWIHANRIFGEFTIVQLSKFQIVDIVKIFWQVPAPSCEDLSTIQAITFREQKARSNILDNTANAVNALRPKFIQQGANDYGSYARYTIDSLNGTIGQKQTKYT